nr:MAG: hypothetical protein [Apis mellifra filamentous-like virus]
MTQPLTDEINEDVMFLFEKSQISLNKIDPINIKNDYVDDNLNVESCLFACKYRCTIETMYAEKIEEFEEIKFFEELLERSRKCEEQIDERVKNDINFSMLSNMPDSVDQFFLLPGEVNGDVTHSGGGDNTESSDGGGEERSRIIDTIPRALLYYLTMNNEQANRYEKHKAILLLPVQTFQSIRRLGDWYVALFSDLMPDLGITRSIHAVVSSEYADLLLYRTMRVNRFVMLCKVHGIAPKRAIRNSIVRILFLHGLKLYLRQRVLYWSTTKDGTFGLDECSVCYEKTRLKIRTCNHTLCARCLMQHAINRTIGFLHDRKKNYLITVSVPLSSDESRQLITDKFNCPLCRMGFLK